MEENAKKRRIFIALNLPKEIKDELAKTLDKLIENIGGVRWVKPDGFHLTLHFLGYLDEPQIEKVTAVMNEMAKKFGPINFEAGEIGAFPTLINPRIIFLDCLQTNGRTVYEMQKKLGEKLSKNGFTIDSRPWQAHLTLGRVKTK
jgi:2'-5' RNA ligase